jgi:hypothetical protein
MPISSILACTVTAGEALPARCRRPLPPFGVERVGAGWNPVFAACYDMTTVFGETESGECSMELSSLLTTLARPFHLP